MFSEESTEFVLVLAVAGVILFISGIWLAAVTPDDAPWIGSLLNDIFESERGLGLGLLFLGVACGLLQAFSTLDFVSHDRDRSLPPRIPDEERAHALAQRIFNPPYAPKPELGSNASRPRPVRSTSRCHLVSSGIAPDRRPRAEMASRGP